MVVVGGLMFVNVVFVVGDVENWNLIVGILGVGVMFGVIFLYLCKYEYEVDWFGVDFMVGVNYRVNEVVCFWDMMIKCFG